MESSSNTDLPQSTIAFVNGLEQVFFENPVVGMAYLSALRSADGQQGQPIVDFRFQQINRLAARLLQATPEGIKGKLLSEVYPPHNTTSMVDDYAAVIETGQAYHRQRFIPQFDCWVNTTCARFGDGVLLTFTDITIVRQLEETQTQQATFVQTVLDNVTCGVVVGTAVRGANGQIEDILMTAVNQRAATMAGHSVAAMVNQRLSVLYPGMYQTPVFDLYVRTIETGEPQDLDVHYDSDGLSIWANLQTTKLADGLIITWTDIKARKEAEQRLTSQNHLWEQIMEQASSMIEVLESVPGANGEIVDFIYRQVNPKSLAVMGRSPDQVIGQRMRTLFPGVMASGVFERLVRVTQTGETYQDQLYYHADGVETWLNVKYIPHEQGVVAMSFDLTPSRRADREKLRQAGLLQTILEHTQGGLVLYDMVPDRAGNIVDFRIVLANRASETITKRPVDYITNRTMLEEHPGLRETSWWEHIQRCVLTGEPQSFVLPYNQDGLNGWFTISFARFEQQILSTFLDVTTLKEAELIQQREAQNLEQIINSTPTALNVFSCVRDETGAIIDLRIDQINESAAQLLGQTRDTLLGQRILQAVPETRDTPVYWAIEEVVKTGLPTRLEIEWFTKTLDVHLAPFQDGVVLSAMDMTLIRQQSKQLSWANQELIRSNESLESFAFIASHDLQEPLRKITSFADILHTQYAPQLPEDVATMLARINTSAERMRLLIQDLLAYSRIKTVQDSLKSVDLNELVANLIEHELWVAIHQSQAQLTIGRLPTLIAEPMQLRQLLQNLLSNAVKFRQASGPCLVEVTSRLLEKSELPNELTTLIELRDGQLLTTSFYELSIQDNGIGFDEKYLDRIFTVFQRLHTKTQYGGSGVGLAICKKIVERHGGAITGQSKLGLGSLFQVYLPVIKQTNILKQSI
ncbi:PAS domain-containing sensor histidine kinase [Spirosoma aerophilum]